MQRKPPCSFFQIAAARKVSTSNARKQYVLSDGDQLREGLSTLLDSTTLCDVKLKAEGKLFHAHKVVLAALSSYFEAMFTRGFKESQGNILTLEVFFPDQALMLLLC